MSNGLAGTAPTTREEVDYGPLPDLLGHLLRRAQGRVFADFADALGDEVSPAEFGLLTLVAANPGITQVRLAAALNLDKSTLSPALARLTRRGLLERERPESDGRMQALRLAPGAEARFAGMRTKVEAHEARIAAPLAPAERRELVRLLHKLLGWGPGGPAAGAVDRPASQEPVGRVDEAPPPP